MSFLGPSMNGGLKGGSGRFMFFFSKLSMFIVVYFCLTGRRGFPMDEAFIFFRSEAGQAVSLVATRLVDHM